MKIQNMKPCPVCGAELHRSDAEAVAAKRELCPQATA